MKKKRKAEVKAAGLSAAVILMAFLLAGCGRSADSDAGPETTVSAAVEAEAAENAETAQTAAEAEAAEKAETAQMSAEAEAAEKAETAQMSAEAEAAEKAETAQISAEAEAAEKAETVQTAAETEEPEAAQTAETADAGKRDASPAEQPEKGKQVVYGDERSDLYLPLLEGKRVAVFSNQTGIVGNRVIETGSAPGEAVENSGGESVFADTGGAGENDSEDAESGSSQEQGLVPFGQNADRTPAEYGEHILDALVRQGADVTVAFSPEHGFRGTEDAGAQVGSYVDEKTGVPVVSLYGSGSMSPSREDLDRFDTLVIDIQDVGLRYYTYYISMYYLMDACAAAGKEVVILDRPNPNGYYVDGPILQDGFYSGVGMLPLPVVHGMTLGELAQMINGEGWLSSGRDACSLTVVPCENYTHDTLTSLVIRPSPNLKDMRAIYLYASTCFFENTACSVGRGTMNPFEIYGSPYLQGAEGYTFTFVPESIEGAHSPVFEGQTCYGKDLREIPLAQIIEEQINLSYVVDAYRALQAQNPGISFFGSADGAGHYWIDYLCGTDQVRRMIEDGSSAEEISAFWQEDVETFKAQRRPYLLYEE